MIDRDMSQRKPQELFYILIAYIFHFVSLIPEVVLCCIRIYRGAHNKKDIVGVVLLEHIGDIIACEPIIRQLKSNAPRCYLIGFVKRPYHEYIVYNKNIDLVIPVKCITIGMLLHHLPVFDRYYILHHNKRMCPICKIPLKKQYGAINITVDNYYLFGSLLKSYIMSNSIFVDDEQPKLHFPDNIADICRALLPPSKYIVIHGRSNEASRDWPADHWDNLINELCQDGILVVEVGTISVFGNQWNNPLYVNLCGKTSLIQMAFIVSRAAFFIGIDSGPAQAAHAAGVPKIILLGNYRGYGQYMPYSGTIEPNKEIIYKESINDIEYSSVYGLFKERTNNALS